MSSVPGVISLLLNSEPNDDFFLSLSYLVSTRLFEYYSLDVTFWLVCSGLGRVKESFN